MSPALRAEVGRVFFAEARALEKLASAVEGFGAAWEAWRWDDYETPPALRSVSALRAEAKRLREEGQRVGGRTLRVVAPSFVAGALVGPDGTLGEVAPILVRHAQGLRTGRALREYATARGWQAAYVEHDPARGLR